MAIFTDFDSHSDMRADLQDFIEYRDVGDEFSWGFSTMEFESVPVFKSHGVPRYTGGTTDGDAKVICADMSVNYMSMLQDITVKPLAKNGPTERVATDAYGTFVSKDPDKIQYVGAAGNVT